MGVAGPGRGGQTELKGGRMPTRAHLGLCFHFLVHHGRSRALSVESVHSDCASGEVLWGFGCSLSLAPLRPRSCACPCLPPSPRGLRSLCLCDPLSQTFILRE